MGKSLSSVEVGKFPPTFAGGVVLHFTELKFVVKARGQIQHIPGIVKLPSRLLAKLNFLQHGIRAEAEGLVIDVIDGKQRGHASFTQIKKGCGDEAIVVVDANFHGFKNRGMKTCVKVFFECFVYEPFEARFVLFVQSLFFRCDFRHTIGDVKPLLDLLFDFTVTLFSRMFLQVQSDVYD